MQSSNIDGTESSKMGGSTAGPQLGETVLEFRGVVKTFGGTIAVDHVSFGLKAGEILALVGENGAGKSTLIKLLAGIHTPDAGEIEFRGKRIDRREAHPPISFIHQDLGLIEWMTVAENIALGKGYSKKNSLIDWRRVEETATQALEAIGGDIDPRVRVQELSSTEKSLVAIARALAIRADVFVLDEPTASLPEDEVEHLFSAIRSLREHGVGVIYVSHRLDEIFRIADRVVVLRDGNLVGEKPIDQTDPRELVQLIVGRPTEQVFARTAGSAGRPMLELRNLVVEGAGPISIEARMGEMIGLAGLRGAGQELIGQALFGLAPVLSGEIRLDNQPVEINGPQEAIKLGISYVPGDRGDSAAMGLSIRENLFFNPKAIGRRLFDLRSPKSEFKDAVPLGERFQISPNAPERILETLSGGNQQKVILGRWLYIGGRVVVLEDPTAGVDVGAKAVIYKLLNKVLEGGNTVIVVSNDFEEIANVCHRAIVFNRGQVVAELDEKNLSIEALLHTASASEHKG